MSRRGKPREKDRLDCYRDWHAAQSKAATRGVAMQDSDLAGLDDQDLGHLTGGFCGGVRGSVVSGLSSAT